MSNSSLSNGTPPDATIEQALRHSVQTIYRNGNIEDLTVKRVRKSTEKDLNLPEDFFKINHVWKDKSKAVIQSEVDAHSDPEPPSSQPTPEKVHELPPRPKAQHQKSQGTKRSSTDKSGPKKRRKKDDSDTEGLANEGEASRKQSEGKGSIKAMKPPPDDSPYSGGEGDNVRTAKDDLAKMNGVGSEQSESDMSDLIDEAPKSKRSRKAKPTDTSIKSSKQGKPAKPSDPPQESDAENVEKSESEMSELIDEPAKSKRSRKSGSTEPKKGAKAKKTSTEPSDPDAEEIKKLQAWLVKCGIRKMWFRELAPYDSSKAKIKHLKEMLAEAGMTGRYSESKAEQIKEERELRADLEAVQEGDKKWGQTTSEEAPGSSRPKRKLAKGLEGLDFLNDDDGEETD